MASTALSGFPPDELSNKEGLDAQRQAEMEDWQREWVPNVIRARVDGDGALLPACSSQVFESLKQWWRQYGTGQPPSQSLVTQTVKSHYRADTIRQHCHQHNRTEHCYVNFAIAQPVNLLPR